MFTSKDIRCFVMTRNRPELLKQTLKTVLWQEGGPWDIWVVDNSPNTDTEKLIKTQYPQIHYEHTIYSNNIKRVQELMDTSYTFLMHDDDLIAPNYLQTALKALNSYPNLAGVFSKYKIMPSLNFPSDLEKQKLSTKHWLIENQADFTLSFWDRPSCCWTGSIIKSDSYKVLDIGRYLNTFGKIFDWPLLIETVGNNKTIIFKDNYIFYRAHKGQDTFDENTAITSRQFLNWLKFFKEFAETNKELEKIYIMRAYDNAMSNYQKFLSKKEQKNCPNLSALLEKEGLNIFPMNIYNKTLEHKLLSPLKHIFRRFLKNNYFEQFITDFK